MALFEGDNAYNQDLKFWETYLKGRPSIPQTFFDQIFDYHAQHGGQFESAHEVGAGIGVYSHRLATRFNHVMVSDVISTNVDIAQSRLHGNYSFRASSLEKTIDLPPNSFDLVFASTMMHFTRVDEAIKAVHHQLKPGGTFAAGLYGTYALHDPRAQAVWHKIVLLICEMIIDKFGLDAHGTMVLQNEASGLDSVGLPDHMFSPALRYSLNFPTKDTMRDMILPARLGIPTLSRLGANDVVTNGWDKGWFSQHDLNGLKDIAASWPHNPGDPELVSLWQDLDQIIGDGKVEGAWMVNLLLATKK